MKNAFYFVLKVLFVFDIIIFLLCLFGYVEKQLDKKTMVNYKIYDVTYWSTNNCNIEVAQYLKIQWQSDN